MEDALRKRATTLDRLWAESNEAGNGVRGSKVFRMLLRGRDHRDGKLQSKLESKLLGILKRIKESDFEAQHPITARGASYRLDFFNVEARLAVEAQSVRWHLGDAWLKKEWKQHNDLSLSGITVLYYSWDDVHFRPEEVEAEIRQMLDRFSGVEPLFLST